MEPIRIVFAELPRMLRDILRASLIADPEMVIVGEAKTLGDLERVIYEVPTDVVIMGSTDSELSPLHHRLFAIDAKLRILAITENGQEISIYEMRPHRVALGQGSPQELMHAIRASMASRDLP